VTNARAVPVTIGRKRTQTQVAQESDEDFDEQTDAILPAKEVAHARKAIISPDAQIENLPPSTSTRSLSPLTPSPSKIKGRKKVPKATTGRKTGGRKRRK
jgi:hypothetical protein